MWFASPSSDEKLFSIWKKGGLLSLPVAPVVHFLQRSTAALKACELGCDAILKGTNVDGVYTSDPRKNAKATKYNKLSFQEALEKGLTVMDNTAFALCQREKVPIIVFNLDDLSNIEKIIMGEKVGTLVT
jgi:uridylate kinase